MAIIVPTGTIMNADVLRDCIKKHTDELVHLTELQDAYENKYPIYKAPKKADWKPDNRLSANFAKYIVDTMTGFFMGIPVSITSSEDAVKEWLRTFNAQNGLEDDLSEVAKNTSIFGRSYYMLYLDEDTEIRSVPVSPMQSFMVYDDSILKRPLYFVRYYKNADDKEVGSFSDSRSVYYFTESATGYRIEEERIHGFREVPAVEFVENEEQMSIFESALAMIDEYNKALSEKANDVDYFGDAYLKVLGAKLDEGELSELRRNRVINFEGDFDKLPEVAFLEKPEADGTQEHLLDRLERLIFLTSMVADINNIEFGTASGIAIKYRLWSMASLAKTKERKFTRSLQQFYRIACGCVVSPVPEDSWMTIDYIITLNYPANLLEETEIAKNLAGIVSKETQMAVLSVVGNPADELEKMEEEAARQRDSIFPLSVE